MTQPSDDPQAPRSQIGSSRQPASDTSSSEDVVDSLPGGADPEEPHDADGPPADTDHEAAFADGPPDRPLTLPEYVRATYPDVTPCSPPSLFTLNGVGTSVWGRRDVNPEDGSYVTTLCLVVLFIPVLGISAYRVADAPQGDGYVFFGKTKLSGFAKGWNLLLALVVGAFVAIGALAPSPGERALSSAKDHEAAGRYAQAVRGYLSTLETSEKVAARQSLKGLVEGGLRQAPDPELLESLSALALHSEGPKLFPPAQDDAYVSLALERAKQDPEAALRILDALEPLAAEEVIAGREQVLVKLNAADPTNPAAASGLALIYERRKQPDKAWAVLEPARDKLGASEGARILGMLLLHRNDLEGTVKVWTPYVSAVLPKAKEALARLEQSYTDCRARATQRLERSEVSQSWIRSYNAAPQDRQQQMIQEYFLEATKEDPGIKRAQAAWQKLSPVIEVALELGIARIERAQELAGEERTQALKLAEDLLVEVQKVQGESARYKLYMGKVHYWLGRPEQGEKLFKSLEDEFKEDAQVLSDVASAYRQVGRSAEARRLVEAAYEVAKDPQLKQGCASFRAILNTGLDDQLAWLRKSDTKDPDVQASLATVEARKAEEEGDDKRAEAHYRRAVQAYDKLPETAVLLNNRALVYRDLWRISGQRAFLEKHVGDFRKASTLTPNHPILVSNLIRALRLEAGELVTGKEIDHARAKLFPDTGDFYALANDQVAYEALVKEYLATSSIQECERLLRKLLLLMPSSHSAVGAYFSRVSLLRSPEQLEKVIELCAKIDFEEYTTHSIGAYHTEDPEEPRHHAAQLAALEATLKSLGKKDRTYAFVLQNVVVKRLSALAFGGKVDGDQLVKEAEEAHEVAPSLRSRLTLVAARAARAQLRLAAAHPPLAETATATRRSLDAPFVLAHALREGGPLADAVKADPDVVALGRLLLDLHQRAPHLLRAWWVVLLEGLGEPQAAPLKKQLIEDRLTRLQAEALYRIAPLNGEQILERAWLLDLSGKAAEAKALLDERAKDGVPLP